MKDISTRKFEVWECESIIEQHNKEAELSLKYYHFVTDKNSDDSTCKIVVKASRIKKNYKNKEDFIREVINTKKVNQ